nr:cytochrome C [uncultured Desulfuromonas sp.]
MKKLVVAIMLVAFAATAAFAADVVTYENSKGNVTFNHKAHSEKNECKVCHGDAAPAKIAIDKAAAHGAACKDCHKAHGGPTKCGECHVK